MKEDIPADDLVEDLRTAFAQRIRDEVTELPTHQALQLADALCAVQMDLMAGRRVAYRARPRVDGAAIAADWNAGRNVNEIVAKHKCSRAKAYEHHPNRHRYRDR